MTWCYCEHAHGTVVVHELRLQQWQVAVQGPREADDRSEPTGDIGEGHRHDDAQLVQPAVHPAQDGVHPAGVQLHEEHAADEAAASFRSMLSVPRPTSAACLGCAEASCFACWYVHVTCTMAESGAER